MVARLFLIYAVLEISVATTLAAAIGAGWTVLVLAATFVFGFLLWAPLAGRQLSTQFAQLRSGMKEPRSALSDGATVTLATGLILVPGLATTVLGLLLLVPPIRAATQPVLTAIAMRRLGARVPLITYTSSAQRRDYIDGEVIDVWDVHDVEPRPLPPRT